MGYVCVHPRDGKIVRDEPLKGELIPDRLEVREFARGGREGRVDRVKA